MIEAKLFLCSDSAAIDVRLNSLSVFHIIEEINAAVFPVVFARITAIMILTREQGDPDNLALQMSISLGERQLFEGPFQVNFLQRLSCRAVVDLNGVVILAPGNLRFQVRHGAREIAAWNVVVNQVGQPRVQPVVVPQPPPAG